MSKGLGHVERKLLELFEKHRSGFFTTRQLCLHVYPDAKTQKKHRVAVLRAIKRLSEKALPQLWRVVVVKKGQRDDLWFDYRAWPKKQSPPNGAPARKKRPRKKKYILFQGKLYKS